MGGHGEGSSGRIFPCRILSWLKRISMKGALDFPALFKKKRKIKFKKNTFFQLRVRSNLKIESEHELVRNRLRGLSLLNTSLFMLKYF